MLVSDVLMAMVFGAFLLIPILLVGLTAFMWLRDWRELRVMRLEYLQEREARKRRRELKLWVNPNAPTPRDE